MTCLWYICAMTQTLTRPTVADLIAALEQFPKGCPVEILDADTGNRIRKFHVGHESSNGYDQIPETHVYLWNMNYQDMSGE